MAALFVWQIIIALVYFLLRTRVAGRQEAAVESVLVLLLPGVGIVSLLVWLLVSRLAHFHAVEPGDLREERVLPSFGQMAYQADVVPLHDIHLMTNAQLKRRLFTTAIKQEIVDNPAILRETINDKDREITYYAVSLLTARNEKLSAELYEIEQSLPGKEGEEEQALLERYAEKLQDFLRTGSRDEKDRGAKQKELLRVLERLAEKLPDRTMYQEMAIRLAIEMGEYDRAEEDIRRARAQNPDAETPAGLALVLAVARHDAAGIRQAVEEIKALPVRLSPVALNAIRFWGGERS